MNTTDSAGNKTRVDYSRTALRVTFGVISLLAVFGNGLVCAVILRCHRTLKNSYNLMILSLAFTDMFTGVILAITPAFVIGDENFPAPENLAGDVFCHIISSQYFVFTCSKISVAIVMLLAIDRWYAMARPIKYKVTFKRWKVILYITSVSIVCCALNWQALIGKKLIMDKGQPLCIKVTLIENQLVSQIYTVAHAALTFLFPVVISMFTFLHLYRVMRRLHYRHAKSSRPKSFNSVLRMCTITGLLLALCWIPNQLFYVLSKFNITQFDTTFHHATVVLAMLNSCLNPWIYGATNRNYRNRFTRIFCFWKNVQVTPGETDITAKERVIRRRDGKKFSKTGPHSEASRVVDCSSFIPEGPQGKPEVPQGKSNRKGNRKITMNGIPLDDADPRIREETENNSNSLQQSEL